MRVGLFLVSPQWPGTTPAQALAETVRVAVLADELGFDEVRIAEHHFMSYGVCPSAITLAGHLLARTTRIAVGTAVSVLPTTHPVALAEQVALLDALEPGRLRLGVGRGGPWRELTVFDGVARYERGFADDLDVLVRALRGTAAGDVALVPPPAGATEVHVAATSDTSVDLAARRGLPLLLGMHAGDAEKAVAVARWADVAGGPGEHVGVAIAHVEDTRAAAEATVRRELPRWLGPGLAGYVRHDGAPRRPRDPDDYADQLVRLHPVGSADDVVDHLAAHAEATGLDRVALMVQTTGDPGRTTATLEAVAAVLPRLRPANSRGARATG